MEMNPVVSPKQRAQLSAVEGKICKPDTLPGAKIQAIDACLVTGLELDPSSIKTCNEQGYGNVGLDAKRKKMCSMDPEDRVRSTDNVSTNRIDLSLDFYLYFYLL